MIEDARMHHVGCLVADMEAAICDHRALWSLAEVSEIFEIQDQSVRVCFVRTQPGAVALEIVQPAAGTSLHALLGRGVSLYHTGYEINDLDSAMYHATAAGCRCMKTFTSEAFDGRRCVFLYTPGKLLIELIEARQVMA